ncbi:MAG: DUF4864 domain-containing protein [Rhodospirillaceae bacterium]|nr:DUF4864 domain-containing protein [Rhodospirillaceae bacterium]
MPHANLQPRKDGAPMPFKSAIKAMVVVLAAWAGLASNALAVGRTDFNTDKDPTTAIHRVIERQLDAIRRDDAEAAFSLAAPNIRRAFKTASTFMALVAKDYLPMKRWEAATFLDLRTFDDHCVQRVKLVDDRGEIAVANYAMVQAASGDWWVAGVTMEPAVRDAKRFKPRLIRPDF